MAKQNIEQRLRRLLTDISSKEEGEVNVKARWKAIAEDADVPGLTEVLAAVGPLPMATLDDIDRRTAVRYAARDADVTLRIEKPLRERMEAMELETVEMIDLAVIPMAERMQTNGIAVNVPHFVKLGKKMTGMMDRTVNEIEELVGVRINPNSGDQVAALIFDGLGLKPRYLTDSGKRGSTDDKTLEGLRSAHAVVPMLTDYREYSKIRDAFCITLPRAVGKDGRIRGTIRVTRVSSGRFSMSEPNLMAIPVRSDLGREIRTGFIAPPGCVLGTCDLDQIEMRVMAHQSKDPTLIRLFQRGEDVHTQTAMRMFGIPESRVDPMKHRYPAKRVGFGVITGITEIGLVEQMALVGIKVEEAEAKDWIASWFDIYKDVKVYQEDKRAEARRYGYVRDMWGRIRFLPGIRDPRKWVREEAERQSHSHDIQASAQGIMKIGMANVWSDVLPRWWKGGHHREPLLQVHDELLFEIGNNKTAAVGQFMDEVKTVMCGAVKLDVPIKAKSALGPNWGALEK